MNAPHAALSVALQNHFCAFRTPQSEIVKSEAGRLATPRICKTLSISTKPKISNFRDTAKKLAHELPERQPAALAVDAGACTPDSDGRIVDLFCAL